MTGLVWERSQIIDDSGNQFDTPTATGGARPWGFWATLGWFGGAIVWYGIVAIGFSVLYWYTWMEWNPGVEPNFRLPMFSYGFTIMTMTASVMPFVIAVTISGLSLRDYLGLNLPKLRHVAIALAALLCFALFLESMSYLFPSMDQSKAIMKQVKRAMNGPPMLYWIVFLVSAPIIHEIIFRGFLFRGWSESKLGALGAIVLTSLIYGALHFQYTWQGKLAVVGLGLILGIARWLSGSTTLTIMMHSAWNVGAIALALSGGALIVLAV